MERNGTIDCIDSVIKYDGTDRESTIKRETDLVSCPDADVMRSRAITSEHETKADSASVCQILQSAFSVPWCIPLFRSAGEIDRTCNRNG